MRILGLDVGDKRIGVAVSDPLNITAQGLDTIDSRHALDRIHKLIKMYGIGKIVVGMPFNMNGSKGERAKLVDDFIDLLRKNFSVIIETVDERLTTKQGERLLLEGDISRRRRKALIDKLSAQLILQAYIDSHS